MGGRGHRAGLINVKGPSSSVVTGIFLSTRLILRRPVPHRALEAVWHRALPGQPLRAQQALISQVPFLILSDPGASGEICVFLTAALESAVTRMIFLTILSRRAGELSPER